MLDIVRFWTRFKLLFVATVPPAEVRARCTWVCLCGFLLLLVSTAAGVERRQGRGGGLTTPQQPGWHPPVCLTASTCNWKGSFPLGSADIRVGEGPSGGPRVSTWHLTLPHWCWERWSRSFPGIHWRKEKADYQPPHPPTLPLSAWLLPRLGAGSARPGSLADPRRGWRLVVPSPASRGFMNSSCWGWPWRFRSLPVCFPQEQRLPA